MKGKQMSVNNIIKKQTLNSARGFVRFSLNYESKENPFLFSNMPPAFGGSNIKAYTPRLLAEVLCPHDIVEGEIMYSYQVLSCAPAYRYNTYMVSKFSPLFGFLSLQRLVRGLPLHQHSLAQPDIDWLEREGVNSQIKELEVPVFKESLNGNIISPTDNVSYDRIMVEGKMDKWQVVHRNYLQQPAKGIYLFKSFRTLQKQNQEARAQDDSVPELAPFERPTKAHFVANPRRTMSFDEQLVAAKHWTKQVKMVKACSNVEDLKGLQTKFSDKVLEAVSDRLLELSGENN